MRNGPSEGTSLASACATKHCRYTTGPTSFALAPGARPLQEIQFFRQQFFGDLTDAPKRLAEKSQSRRLRSIDRFSSSCGEDTETLAYQEVIGCRRESEVRALSRWTSVTKTFPWDTTGRDHPNPTGLRQRTGNPAAGIISNMPDSVQTPSRFGPRHCGQSVACATMVKFGLRLITATAVKPYERTNRFDGSGLMKRILFALLLSTSFFVFNSTGLAESRDKAAAEERQNNLVTILLKTGKVAQPNQSFAFHPRRGGFVFLAVACQGKGTATFRLDDLPEPIAVVQRTADGIEHAEALKDVSAQEHTLHIACDGEIRIEQLVIKAIPELVYCGLGFDPAIQSYGKYNLEFLKKEILPNVTTIIVPSNIELNAATVDDLHRQGKKIIAEVGINSQAKTAEEHYGFWTGFLEKSPSLDGIIIDEFIVNNPIREWLPVVTPERQRRFDEERAQYPLYEQAFRRIRENPRYRDKMVYAYIGGSGKRLNQEIIGPTFVHSLIDCKFRIGLERYLFEVSSEQKSQDVLQSFVDGINDWYTKEPLVRDHLILALGLFSMPPGGINKLPNVDFHVWMDQQMHVVANHPAMAGLAGLNWWTSSLADEETVRFVGKLYRHYAIEGKKELLTKDPLFLTHIQNADFAKQLDGWTIHAAEQGSIQVKSFPRYGRIEGRYMGLGRPADPEHIGDTFLWMKRSARGPNTVSQPIKDLQPGRLYSLKMLTCDYEDLVHPRKKTKEEARPFIGNVSITGVEFDKQRSFQEVYASSPEPPIPVWITYHWIVFRAGSSTATLTVSDWDADGKITNTFGQEQSFNFLELQPYHE